MLYNLTATLLEIGVLQNYITVDDMLQYDVEKLPTVYLQYKPML